MSNTSSNPTAQHYESHSADSYEAAYFYEPGPYMQHLCDLVRQRLDLSSGTLLDVGGGTGNFTRMLIDDETGARAIVVDPFLEHHQEEDVETNGDEVPQLRFVKASAESFMKEPLPQDFWWRQDYQAVLLKEVVHHFATADRLAIFKGMYQGLVGSGDGNSLLIVTRPQRDIDYPLWNEARDVWALNQPGADELVEDLQQAGFSQVQYTVESYPCQITLKRWQAMVQGRFWSTFYHFTDEQLEAACQEVAATQTVDEKGILHFEDRLVFITARKEEEGETA